MDTMHLKDPLVLTGFEGSTLSSSFSSFTCFVIMIVLQQWQMTTSWEKKLYGTEWPSVPMCLIHNMVRLVYPGLFLVYV